MKQFFGLFWGFVFLANVAVGQTVTVSVPNVQNSEGKTFRLPVTVSDLTGLKVFSYDLTLVYDPSVLTALDARTSGSLSAPWGPATKNISNGQIQVGIGGTTALSGAGVLIYLIFKVNSGVAIGKTSTLTFTKFKFNEGTPDVQLNSGTFTVILDTDPPQITSGPEAINVTSHSTHIRWRTDEPATSQVEYGTTTAYGKSESQSSLVTSHDLALHNLKPATTYHFRVSSSDKLGNGPSNSSDQTFTTVPIVAQLPALSLDPGADIVFPLTISDVSEQNITDAEMTITYDPAILSATGVSSDGTLISAWNAPTFQAESGRVTIQLSGNTPLNGSGVLVNIQFHIAKNSKIGQSTVLVFDQLKLLNSGGEVVKATTKDGHFTVEDTRPPEIISGPDVESVTAKSAVVIWETNEKSTSLVRYGPSLDYGWEKRDQIHHVRHRVLLTNLSPSTTYHFVVGSVDSSGNGPTFSSDAAFTTGPGTGVILSVPNTIAHAGADVTVPLKLTDVTDQGVRSYTVVLAYDSDLISAVSAQTAGTLTKNWGAPNFQNVDGQVVVHGESGTPLSGAGTLVNLVFHIHSSVTDGLKTPLSLVFAQLNSGMPEVSTASGELTLRGTPDRQAPKIVFGPFVQNISATGAQIVWETDEPATGTVEFGTSTSYGQTATASEDPEKIHRVAFSGLLPGTTYHFRVTSSDRWGNGPTASQDASFQTTNGGEVQVTLPDRSFRAGTQFDWPIQISDVTGKAIYSADITVAFDPNILTAISATTNGTRASAWGPPTTTIRNGKIILAMGGIQALSGSGNLVKIRFQVSGAVEEGAKSLIVFKRFVFNEGTPASIYKEGLFTVKDVTAPKLIAGPTVVQITGTTATILWATDEPSTAKIEYGETQAYGQVVENSFLEKTHLMVLTGLFSGTQYHFRVSSSDAGGNGPSQSSDQTFQTTVEQPFVLRIPTVQKDVGSTFDLPVELDSIGNGSLYAFKMKVKFDSRYLEVLEIVRTGCLTEGWTAPAVTFGEDSLLIEMSTSNPIRNNGTIFRVRFHVKADGVYNQITPISLEDVSVNGQATGFFVRNGSFTLLDQSPPQILSGPTATEIGAHSAHLVWTTNEPADSRAEYGSTTDYGNKVSKKESVTYHDLVIAGLQASTTYHFRVGSADTLGNGPTWSGDATFNTTAGNEVIVTIPDTLAPVGQNLWYPISVEDVTGQNIRQYRFVLAYDSSAVRALAVRKTETLTETWANPSVTITDTSISVSQSGSTALSGSGILIQIQFQIKPTACVGHDVGLIFKEFTFNSGDPPASPNSARWLLVDRTPPKFEQGPEVVEIGYNYAVISWKNNELTTGLVKYGTSAIYDNQQVVSSPSLEHKVTIENLRPLTTYHLAVSVKDTAGNGPVVSDDLAFRTLSDTVSVFVPDTTVAIGSTFDLTLHVTNLTGFDIKHFSMDISYDPNQLSALGASSSGTLTEGWGVPTFSTSNKILHVDMTGNQPLKGEGVLVRLTFQLLGGVVPESDFILPFKSFSFNKGKPVAKVKPAKIHAVAGGKGVVVSLPDTSFFPGVPVQIPITVGNLSQKGVYAFAGKMTFSHAVLKITGATSAHALAKKWGDIYTKNYSDSVVFNANGTEALADSGVLFYFTGYTYLESNEGDTTALRLQRFLFNRGNPVASVKNGRVEIVIRHDAISGKVFESDSTTVLPGATIFAQETRTQKTKSAVSDTRGFFQIVGLDSQKTYMIYATKSGYTPSDKEKNVKAGTRNLKLYLEKENGYLDGWVKSNLGEPVVGALVVADDGHKHFGSGNTDSTGHFAINHLARRYPYTLKFTKYGFHDRVLSGVTVNQTLNITMNWFYGQVCGTVKDTSQTPMDSVWVQALNLKKGAVADSFLTTKTGGYILDSLKANQYLVYAIRNGYVSTPNQITVNLAPGDTVKEDFILEKAVLASIEISGDLEIPNNVPSHFDFVAKTASGKVMRLKSPIWKLWPQVAGVVSQGVVYPDSQYFGEAFLSITDFISGISDTLAISLYAPVTPITQAVVRNADGVTLEVQPGSVEQPQKIKIQTIELPAVKKSTKHYAAIGKAYLLKPGGYHFLKSLRVTCPVPQGYDPTRAIIGKWNQEKAGWEVLPTSAAGEQAVAAEVESFSLLSVLNPSRNLGLEDLTLTPNPFSPLVDSDGDGVPGLTIRFLVTSRDARRPFVSIRIFNIVGQPVRTLLDHHPENKDQWLSFHWDGVTDDGRSARNGRYIVKIDVSDATGTKTQIKTAILVK